MRALQRYLLLLVPLLAAYTTAQGPMIPYTPSPAAAGIVITSQGQTITSSVAVATICPLALSIPQASNNATNSSTGPLGALSTGISTSPVLPRRGTAYKPSSGSSLLQNTATNSSSSTQNLTSFGLGPCKTFYSPTITAICSTTVSVHDLPVAVTNCAENIIFSSYTSGPVCTPQPLSPPSKGRFRHRRDVHVANAAQQEDLTTYLRAPWRSFTPGAPFPPATVDVLICGPGFSHCITSMEVWAKTTSTITMTSTKTVEFTATDITGPAQVQLAHGVTATMTSGVGGLSISTVVPVTETVQVMGISRGVGVEVAVTVTPSPVVEEPSEDGVVGGGESLAVADGGSAGPAEPPTSSLPSTGSILASDPTRTSADTAIQGPGADNAPPSTGVASTLASMSAATETFKPISASASALNQPSDALSYGVSTVLNSTAAFITANLTTSISSYNSENSQSANSSAPMAYSDVVHITVLHSFAGTGTEPATGTEVASSSATTSSSLSTPFYHIHSLLPLPLPRSTSLSSNTSSESSTSTSTSTASSSTSSTRARTTTQAVTTTVPGARLTSTLAGEEDHE